MMADDDDHDVDDDATDDDDDDCDVVRFRCGDVWLRPLSMRRSVTLYGLRIGYLRC